MKKLLATLLVAVMIMSCMTVVSFAADYSVYLDATPTFDFTLSNPNKPNKGYANDLEVAYYDFASEYLDDTYTEGTLAYAMDEHQYNDAEAPVFTGYNANDIIAVPVYTTGMGTITVDIEWDPAYLTYVSAVGDYNADTKDLDTAYGYICFNGFTGGDNVDGLFGVLFFVVADGATGDAGVTTATTTVTLKLQDGLCQSAGANPVNAELTNGTMAIALSGLVAGEEAGDDYIAAEDIAAPVAVQGSYADYSAEKSAYTIVSGDGNEMAEGMVYTAMFATVENSDDYAEYGVALKSTGGYLHYAAMTEGDKFGILLFGENDLMANYNACTYVKYADGTVVYGANVVAVR